MSLLLRVIVTYYTNYNYKNYKNYTAHPETLGRAINRPLFVKKPLSTGDLSSAFKIFIGRPDGLNLHLKQNSLLVFFCFKLFICYPDTNIPDLFSSFTPLKSPWLHHEPILDGAGDYNTSRPPSAFYNISKLSLCSEMGTGKTLNKCLQPCLFLE